MQTNKKMQTPKRMAEVAGCAADAAGYSVVVKVTVWLSSVVGTVRPRAQMQQMEFSRVEQEGSPATLGTLRRRVSEQRVRKRHGRGQVSGSAVLSAHPPSILSVNVQQTHRFGRRGAA
jgi:hypothetical protein